MRRRPWPTLMVVPPDRSCMGSAPNMALLSVASLIIGSAIFGAEPMQLLSGGTTISVGQGLLRIAASYAFVLVGMAAVVSLATLFSTLANSSLTAVFGALVLVIVMQVLGSFSVFDFLEPYLVTSHFDAWQNLFRHPIVWEPMWKGLINFVVWIVGTTGLGYVVFQRKDVLTCCLLYTSDAADDLLCVDLGGRRII